ncbi:hypothetical protein JYT20_01500 [Rhodothermus sp. AH-315-K08]|nr:hypothetical protein [Rhodothermus sp. AH-315-K08]
MVRLWGRKVSDISWGEFVRTLEYACKKRGEVLKKVEPAAINVLGRAFPNWRGDVSGHLGLAQEGVAVAA